MNNPFDTTETEWGDPPTDEEYRQHWLVHTPIDTWRRMRDTMLPNSVEYGKHSAGFIRYTVTAIDVDETNAAGEVCAVRTSWGPTVGCHRRQGRPGTWEYHAAPTPSSIAARITMERWWANFYATSAKTIAAAFDRDFQGFVAWPGGDLGANVPDADGITYTGINWTDADPLPFQLKYGEQRVDWPEHKPTGGWGDGHDLGDGIPIGEITRDQVINDWPDDEEEH